MNLDLPFLELTVTSLASQYSVIRDEGAHIGGGGEWVYLEQIIVKSTQFRQNLVLFLSKWYTAGWVIG